MKFTDIPTALLSVYNYSRQSEAQAVNYQMIFGVRSTLPKEELKFRISLSKKVINEIESYCDPRQLAVLRYKYGFVDRFGDVYSIEQLASIAYDSNLYIGKIISSEWRGDLLINNDLTYTMQVMSILNIQKTRAREIINHGKSELSKFVVPLINTDYALADKIYKLLRMEDMMF